MKKAPKINRNTILGKMWWEEMAGKNKAAFVSFLVLTHTRERRACTICYGFSSVRTR